jgi:hypothetical protein
VLEEFLDARHVARARAGAAEPRAVLSQLRSRRGFESCWREGFFADPAPVRQALAETALPVTQAYLLPLVPDARELPPTPVTIEPVVLERLRSVAPASPLHLSLVELVRRQYKAARQAADRADKQAIRASQAQTAPPPQSPDV